MMDHLQFVNILNAIRDDIESKCKDSSMGVLVERSFIVFHEKYRGMVSFHVMVPFDEIASITYETYDERFDALFGRSIDEYIPRSERDKSYARSSQSSI